MTGYLGDEDLAVLSFLKGSPWLLKGAPDGSVSDRRSRLHKTGDLVRYNPVDGTIIFVERSDTRTKLPGQKIEFSKLKHHVRSCVKASVEDSFAVVAEIVEPQVTIFEQFKHEEGWSGFDQLTY